MSRTSINRQCPRCGLRHPGPPAAYHLTEDAHTPGLSEAERDALDDSLMDSGCHGFRGDHPDLYAAVERILAARADKTAAEVGDDAEGEWSPGDSIREAVDAWCLIAPDDADVGAFTRAEVADWFFRWADSQDALPGGGNYALKAAADDGLRAQVEALVDEAKARKAGWPEHPHWSVWDLYERDLRDALAATPAREAEDDTAAVVERVLPALLVEEYGETARDWRELGSVKRIAKALAAALAPSTPAEGGEERG